MRNRFQNFAFKCNQRHYNAGMRDEPLLQALALRRPALMLDTTYCAPQHVFPPQTEVLAAVRDAVLAEAFNPKVLFLFGTYTIGKEKVGPGRKCSKCQMMEFNSRIDGLECAERHFQHFLPSPKRRCSSRQGLTLVHFLSST